MGDIMMKSGFFGESVKYNISDGICFFTQKYDAPSGFCAVPGEKTVLEISWCRSGRMECRMKDGCVLYMGEGDIFLSMTDNHADTLEFPTGHYEGVAVSVDPSSDAVLPDAFLNAGVGISQITSKFFGKDDCFLIKKNDATASFFEPVFHCDGEVKKLYMKLKTFELLLYLSEYADVGSPMIFYHKAQTDIVKDVLEFLKSDLSARHTAEELAERFHISRTGLNTTFRAVYGRPISAYMKEERMRAAADILISEECGVTVTASRVGYESYGKFSRAFREYFGLSPAEYRKKFKNV